ncbi:hypothetical protein OB236_13180 [Paenibacillus sp. WQ 127069]|uniref:Uncharacterized protein n=1 Tax=Paenibacillus baimaensis TaxID=2982185 RepID=A0ABT2UEP0_9BACL|nr:hypothetical protein [Paenibacillus sp. WQ 127069]MCU6793072.1 hypothetical protein [Paenibacillus sp. WQ 127069]
MLINDQRMYQRRIQNFTREEFQGWFNRLFNEIYGTDYEATTPHGNHGDLKVDGRILKTGEYFACYSPDKYRDLYFSTKVMEDFRGLKKHWLDKGYPIKTWHFVMPHDIHPGAAQAIFDKLQLEHNSLVEDEEKKIKFEPFTLTYLMGLLNKLSIHQHSYIFGDTDDYVKIIQEDFERATNPSAAMEYIRITYNREARQKLPLPDDVWDRRLNALSREYNIGEKSIPFVLNENNGEFNLENGACPFINLILMKSFFDWTNKDDVLLSTSFDDDFLMFQKEKQISVPVRDLQGNVVKLIFNPIVEVW